MSTERLDISDDLEKELGRLGSETAQHPGKIEHEIKGRQRHIRHVAFGASAVIQRQENEIDALEEERQQMEEIAARAERLLGADEELARLREENEQLRREQEATEQPPALPAPAPEPTPPAPPAPAPTTAPAVPDDSLVPGLPDQLQPAPPAEGSHPEPEVRRETVVEEFNGIPQTIFQWVLALIGAIVLLVIGLDNRGFVHDLPDAAEAAVQAFFVAGLVAAGFGLGGLIGWSVEHLLRRRRPRHG